ncbi:MAG: hypothetical protein OEY23_25245 [Acidimicrobiia bacterium]|nr:hypothetical protein [Acidimicrobiia bacterium]
MAAFVVAAPALVAVPSLEAAALVAVAPFVVAASADDDVPASDSVEPDLAVLPLLQAASNSTDAAHAPPAVARRRIALGMAVPFGFQWGEGLSVARRCCPRAERR